MQYYQPMYCIYYQFLIFDTMISICLAQRSDKKHPGRGGRVGSWSLQSFFLIPLICVHNRINEEDNWSLHFYFGPFALINDATYTWMHCRWLCNFLHYITLICGVLQHICIQHLLFTNQKQYNQECQYSLKNLWEKLHCMMLKTLS